MKEEITVSSDDSDFDDEEDPDSVEVPGGGKDLKTISKIGEPSLTFPSQSAATEDALILPSAPAPTLRAKTPQQPGYEVIRIPPGASPFGLGAGIKQQAANAMQTIGLIRGNLPAGGAVRVNVPLSAVQSMLKSNVFQVSKDTSQ